MTAAMNRWNRMIVGWFARAGEEALKRADTVVERSRRLRDRREQEIDRARRVADAYEAADSALRSGR